MTKFGSRGQKTRFGGKRRIDDPRLFGHPRQTILGVNVGSTGRKMTPKTGQNKVKSVKKCLFFFRIVINFYRPQNFERLWSGMSKICTKSEKTGSEFGTSLGSPLEGFKTPKNAQKNVSSIKRIYIGGRPILWGPILVPRRLPRGPKTGQKSTHFHGF
jgi:hypothetical protein